MLNRDDMIRKLREQHAYLAAEYGASDASHPIQTTDAVPVAQDDEVIVDAAELKRRVRKR